MTSHKPKTWKAWGVFDPDENLRFVRFTKPEAVRADLWADYRGRGPIRRVTITLAKPRRPKK